MKYAFVAVTLAAVASAQTLADIPSCAIPCLDKSIAANTSCDKTDIACICKNFDKVQGDATSCVLKDCGTDVAINEVLPAAEKLCANPPSGSTSKAEEAPATTSAAPVESKPAEAASSSVAPVETKPVETPTPAPMPTVVEPPKEPETTPVPTAAAAPLGYMGGLAMAVLGALAL